MIQTSQGIGKSYGSWKYLKLEIFRIFSQFSVNNAPNISGNYRHKVHLTEVLWLHWLDSIGRPYSSDTLKMHCFSYSLCILERRNFFRKVKVFPQKDHVGCLWKNYNIESVLETWAFNKKLLRCQKICGTKKVKRKFEYTGKIDFFASLASLLSLGSQKQTPVDQTVHLEAPWSKLVT